MPSDEFLARLGGGVLRFAGFFGEASGSFRDCLGGIGIGARRAVVCGDGAGSHGSEGGDLGDFIQQG